MTTNNKFEEKLILALEMYREERIAKHLKNSRIDEDYEFSPRFEKKMNKLIKAQRKFYYPLISTVGRKAAAIIIIFLAMFGAVMSSQALRDPFVNFIVNTYEKFSEIIFQSDGQQTPGLIEIEKHLVPQYLPDGYVLFAEEKHSRSVDYEYKNNNGDLIIYIQRIFTESGVGIDTEGVKTEVVTVNGLPGIYFCNKGESNIIWNDGVYIYGLYAPENIDREELWRIAESLG